MTGFRNINLKNNKLRLSFAGLSAIYFSRFNLRLTYPSPIMGSSQGNSAPKPHKTVLRHIYRILSSGGSILWMLQRSCTLEFTFLIKRLQFSSQDNLLFTIVPPTLSYLPFYLLTFKVLSSCLLPSSVPVPVQVQLN